MLGVSVRGTGSSEGVFTSPFAPQEGADGKTMIDWAAEQPWCDGNVGMYGNFYAGVSQLEVAAQHPKALKALAASEIWGDTYEELCYPGGIFNFGFVGQWSYQTQPYFSATGVHVNRQFNGDIRGCEARAANPTIGKTFAEMRAHPFLDNVVGAAPLRASCPTDRNAGLNLSSLAGTAGRCRRCAARVREAARPEADAAVQRQ